MSPAGFEPAKHYAVDLESTPFDRSGTATKFYSIILYFILSYLKHQFSFCDEQPFSFSSLQALELDPAQVS